MATLNTALLEQLLHIPVAEREAVVQPNRVLDNADWEAVAIGYGVSHGPTLPDNLIEPVEVQERPGGIHLLHLKTEDTLTVTDITLKYRRPSYAAD